MRVLKILCRLSRWRPSLALGLLVLPSALLATTPGAGIKPIQVVDPVAGGTMPGYVFYPSPQPVDSPVAIALHLVDATPDAPAEPGAKPLVVISHGQGGENLGHHDLATHLARAGFVVATLTHARDNPRDSSGAGTAEVLFGRPLQIQALVSTLLDDPHWAPLIDPGRIGVAGFSDGGYTSLLLVGAVPRFDRYAGYCERQPQDRDTCSFIEQLGARSDIDGDGDGDGMKGFLAHAASLDGARTRWGETADPRIRAAFTMAPSSVMFDREGATSIDRPVFLYYGTKDRRLIPAEHALHLAPLIRSTVEVREVPGADHWVFLAPCAPALAEAVPEICGDPPGVDRAAVHAQVNADAVAFFRRTLAPAPAPGGP
ncbi:alpha/beta hydrolase family protein [Luteimonas arsenica]|uniref:alpha/beta hydrolase family protein n=1 Tax=Luteimonas arsenica TaxID=1586242 RepID=UPI001055B6B6|nr:hypothetical protein [Luteimonas arsenica]